MFDAVLSQNDPLTLLLVGAICFAAAAVGGMSGFGSGMIMSAGIAPFVGVKAIVPLISVTMIVTNGTRIWAYASSLDIRLAAFLLVTSIPASILGAAVYVELNDQLVSLIFGSVLIASIPLNHVLRHRRFAPNLLSLGVIGVIFGFLSSNMVGAGLIIPPVLFGAGLTATGVIATDAAIALGTSLFKVATFGAMDALTVPMALFGLFMGLFTIPGTWAAKWVMARTGFRIQTILVEACIAIAGASFIYKALSS